MKIGDKQMLFPVWPNPVTSGDMNGCSKQCLKVAAETGAAAYGMMVAIDNRENVNEIMLDAPDRPYTV